MNAVVSPAFHSARSNSHVIKHDESEVEIAVFPQFSAGYDRNNAALWSTWAPRGIPCFNLELLNDLDRGSRAIEARFANAAAEFPLRYVIVRSAVSKVFNVGGDLGYFHRLIETQDRAALAEYSRLAVDVVYRNYIAHNVRGVTTVALLEGDALGGGFESALSCDIVVAEKHVKAGFPEVLFNMFPGMGGLSFLARRAGRNTANELTRTGRQYSAQELFELGVIDMVVETGEGVEAVNRLMRQRERQHEAHAAMNSIDRLLRPVSLSELHEVVQMWVDCALRLPPRSLEWMSRLHRQQLAAFGGAARLELVPAARQALAA